MSKKFNITGMTCTACSGHIEKSLAKTAGVKSVSVNLLANNMMVDFEDGAITEADICRVVADAGYGATPASSAKTTVQPVDQTAQEAEHKKKQFLYSMLFLVPLLYVSMGTMFGAPVPEGIDPATHMLPFAFTQFLLTLPIIYLNMDYFTHGFRALYKRSPNMDSLIAVGSSAALIYGIYIIFSIAYSIEAGNHHAAMMHAMDLYFESAATILTLITLGKYLEARSKSKTSEAITKLMDLAPKVATVLRGDAEVELPVEQVQIGDIIIVRPGQGIPVDGIVTEGTSAVDEAAITGESLPVEKNIGSPVIAATVNKGGYLRFKATKVGDDMTISQIIRLVEEASSSKAPIAKMADKVAAIFVPTVMAIALLAIIVWLIVGASFDFALSIGIAVLVISCPCALGLATPVAIMVGTGKGAQHGILIKSAEALETAHSINTVILDKTGTVTEGKPRVTDIMPFGKTEVELLSLAAAVEKKSEHPLADAIISHANELGMSIFEASDFVSTPGEGVSALVLGNRISAGNIRMMTALGADTSAAEAFANSLAEDGKTPLFFAENQKLIGVIGVADVLKAGSIQAVAALKAIGVEVVMLTGDNKKTAEAIGRQLGIERVLSEVLPQDKEQEVRALQANGKLVAMIGDGINDAPALMRADVGIAIGAGTDIAMEAADIVLMKSDLLDAVTAIELSRAVIRNIKQNLFWAFFYNCVGIPLAAGVFYSILGYKLSPTFAAAAMSLSSVSVVTNALRLKLFTPSVVKNKTAPAPMAATAVLAKEITNNKNSTTEGEIKMIKTMKIDGMTCAHCSGRVEKALNALDGVKAVVDLEQGTATIDVPSTTTDDVLRAAVTDAGYDVISVN